MRNIIYARKYTGSAVEQAQSIRAQIIQMKKIAKAHNIPVAGVMVEDGGAAAKPRIRPVFRKLVKDIKSGNVDGIFITEFSRLGHRATEAGEIIRLLRAGKLQWIRTKDRVLAGIEDGQNIDAYRMTLQTAHRTSVSRGMRLKAQRGGFPYRAPWGYTNDRLSKSVKPDAATFPRVKRAWKLLLEGKSLAEIVVAIPFGPNALPSGRATPETRIALLRMFRNPFYCGMVRYKDEVYPGTHVEAVSTDEFEAVQRLLHEDPDNKQ